MSGYAFAGISVLHSLRIAEENHSPLPAHRWSRLRMAYANNAAASQMAAYNMLTLTGSFDTLCGVHRGIAQI